MEARREGAREFEGGWRGTQICNVRSSALCTPQTSQPAEQGQQAPELTKQGSNQRTHRWRLAPRIPKHGVDAAGCCNVGHAGCQVGLSSSRGLNKQLVEGRAAGQVRSVTQLLRLADGTVVQPLQQKSESKRSRNNISAGAAMCASLLLPYIDRC